MGSLAIGAEEPLVVPGGRPLTARTPGTSYEDFVKDLDHKLHRKRVLARRGQAEVDNKPPTIYRHLSDNLKGKQQMMDLQVSVNDLGGATFD